MGVPENSLPTPPFAQDDDGDSLTALPYPPRDFAQSISLPRARLDYCVRMIPKLLVRDWIESGKSCFIRSRAAAQHLASSLQDAYSGCAVYMGRNEKNGAIINGVVRDVCSKVLELDTADSFEMELAKLQALVMLHTLLLFEPSDSEVRVAAEQCMAMVRAEVLRIQRRVLEVPEDLLGTSKYHQWLLVEEVQRTVLAATLAENIYTMKSQGVCQTVAFLSMLPITVAGKLWRAPSEAEWAELAEVTPLTVLPYGEAVGWWREEAEQGTLDGLQYLLYVTCKGVAGASEPR